MTERYESYRNYIDSQSWKDLRYKARERAGGRCELCGVSPVVHVHHIKYPKQFKDDCVSNLLAVCDVCHAKVHGEMTMKLSSAPQVVVESAYPAPGSMVPFSLFKGRTDNGDQEIYSLSQIMSALREEEKAEPPSVIAFRGKGKPVFDIVREAFYLLDADEKLEFSGKNWVTEPGLYHLLFALEHQFKPAKRLMRWVTHELLPKARRGLVVEIGQVTPLQSLFRALQSAATAIEDLDKRKEDKKNPNEYITTRVGLIEKGKDPEQLDPTRRTRRNLQEIVGIWCRDNKCSPGEQVLTRMSGASMDFWVNTWKREDIYKAIEAIGS